MKIKTKFRKYKCPQNRLFVIAVVFLLIFLLLELLIRSYNLYKHAPSVDLPSHFLAGIALAASAYWIMSLNRIEWKKRVSVFLTFLAAGIWEIMETLEQLVFYNPPHLVDVFFWDGVADIIVTVLGGVFILAILHYKRL